MGAKESKEFSGGAEASSSLKLQNSESKSESVNAFIAKPVLNTKPNSIYFEGKLLEDPEEIEENRKLIEATRNSKLFKLLLKSEQKTAEELKAAQKAFKPSLHPEDKSFWKKLPTITFPNGLPFPRKAIESNLAAGIKIVDFVRQFQFGLWGFYQRPYPGEKPFDIQQAYGIENLHNRYYDFSMKAGGWYYKDRLGRSRGPMELVQMKTAWAAGIIDGNTFIWGDDMDEWTPIGQVYGLCRAVASPDLQFAANVTHAVHSIAHGKNPFRPKKGHELNTLEKLQEAAIASKEREQTILRNEDGVWPGDHVPSHVLGMWAGGSQLTEWLEAGNKHVLPDRFIPYHTRKRLAEVIPGLRPWEILEAEHLWAAATFRGKFYREEMGTLTGLPEFVNDAVTQMEYDVREVRGFNREILNAVNRRLPAGKRKLTRRKKTGL